MFWAQALTSFALWLTYGVFQARRGSAVRKWATAMPAGRRGIYAALLFLGGALLMFLCLMAVAAGKGLTPGGLTGWAWALVALSGMGFVHAQTLAMALVVVSAQHAVTAERLAASETSDRSGVSS